MHTHCATSFKRLVFCLLAVLGRRAGAWDQQGTPTPPLTSLKPAHISTTPADSTSLSLKKPTALTPLAHAQTHTYMHTHRHIYPLFLGFPSYLGHHRALSKVPCAVQSVLISYLFYLSQCIHANYNLPIRPTAPFLPWHPYTCSLHLCLYSFSTNKFSYTIFLDSTCMC